MKIKMKDAGWTMKKILFRYGLGYRKALRLALLVTMALAFELHPITALAASTITYVQGNYADPQTSPTSVNVTFTGAQTAGNLNVVVVGWNNSTATVNSVSDSKGNVYTRAVGPTVVSGFLSQSIYYAKNIVSAAAGSNIVTVTFSTAAAYPDIRILEYSGADPATPVDVTAANSGSSTSSSSGSATTTNATDLIFGANMVYTTTTGAGSGFTKRLLTSPDADIAEDRMVTATGSYSATAPIAPSGRWIMQMVAFRTGPNFAISASPASLTVAQGNLGTSTITTTVSGGFSSSISLSATGVPTGTTVSFNPSTIPAPGAGSSTMTITVGASTPVGTYPITVTGNGGGIQQSTTVSLTVTTPPNFAISASPSSLTIAQGNVGTSTITTTVSGGFSSLISSVGHGSSDGNDGELQPEHDTGSGRGQLDHDHYGGSEYAGGNVSHHSDRQWRRAPANRNRHTDRDRSSQFHHFGLAVFSHHRSRQPGDVYDHHHRQRWIQQFDQSVGHGSSDGDDGELQPEHDSGAGCGQLDHDHYGGGQHTGGNVSDHGDWEWRWYAAERHRHFDCHGNPDDSNKCSCHRRWPSTNRGCRPKLHQFHIPNGAHDCAVRQHRRGLDRAVSLFPCGRPFTPSDNFGNTWVTIAGPTNTSVGFDLRTQIWYVSNPIVGSGQTVTMTLSAPESLVMSIFVVKGSNISSPVDAVSLIGSDNGTQTVNVVSPNITTSTANDLLMGWVKVSAGAVFTSGPGFTQQPGASSNFLDAESGTAAVPGVYNATFTLNSPQTWQSAVVAANNNPNQTTLTWTASTESGGTIAQYLVERCQGTGCGNFVQIGTTTTTNYSDLILTASTSYSYRVRAQDTAGTLGPYSAVVFITIPATIPSLPGNLVATTVPPTEIDLSWMASTETNGVIGEYLVERCQGANCSNFAQIGTSLGTTYDDTGLTAGTAYNYRVRAMDSAGSLGPYSNVASGTTAAGSFTLSASPTALTVAQGNQGTSTITTTVSGGFNNSISLSAAGAPTGTTVSFNPSTIPAPGAGTSTMTIAVGSTTPVGTYPITVTGNGGGIPQTATVTLTVTSTQPGLGYVQGNYATPQAPQTAVNVAFTAAQVAGDLNVIVVGWNDSTASISSVTDSKGNAYILAVGPTIISGTLSQSIYYAKNIVSAAAGTNTVTVTFSTAAVYPDVRILEYSGADPNSPVDVTAANTGNSAASSSGSATTTDPIDLLFGANIVATFNDWSRQRLCQSLAHVAGWRYCRRPGSRELREAIPPPHLSSAGAWIMQMVAFRATAAGGPVLASIAVTPINPVISVGAPQQFTATGTYSDGSHQDLTNSANWTSSIPSVATISNTGLATGVAPGSTTIQAAVGLINGSTSLTVTAGFSVSPRAAVVTLTQTQQFTATSGFGSVTWLVDGVVGGSPSSGTITTNGLYTPPSSVGTHTVTATANQQPPANATVYVSNYPGTFTYHNDNLRTGQNNNETVLTAANVNEAQFGKLFSYSLDGIAFASPLYVASVSIPGKGFHNVVYVATEHDSVYAFDADGLSPTPLWHVNFLGSGVTTVPPCDTGECTDIPVEIGVTGTPVIDQSSGTLYVVANTKEHGTNYGQRLHALDITTGAEKFGGPVVLQGSVPGTGDGSSGGTVPFDPLLENQRPGLLLTNGVVYLGFGSHGDNHPWHGWVMGYEATTLQQVMIYNVTPNTYGGGIWQGGGGLATDATGNIYFTTGNGTFDVNTGGVDYGDSVEKISPSGSVVDYFTPHDQQNMDVNDLDLGSGGPVLLVDQPSSPYPHELISAGKSGTIYVTNRDNMGHYNPNNDNQIIQSLPGVLPHGDGAIGNFSTPVYFNGYVYFAAVNDYLKAFQLTNGLLSAGPTSQSPEIYPVRGGSFAISANGNANGILWAIQNNGASPDNDTGAPGVLFAYDATNLHNELYNSSMAGGRDTLDLAAKFAIPLVANGKVFAAGQSQLTAFGLLP